LSLKKQDQIEIEHWFYAGLFHHWIKGWAPLNKHWFFTGLEVSTLDHPILVFSKEDAGHLQYPHWSYRIVWYVLLMLSYPGFQAELAIVS